MSEFIDLKGKIFGDLEVLDLDYKRNEIERERKEKGEIKNAKLYWICKCNYNGCGNITSIEGHELRTRNRNKCSLHRYSCHINEYDTKSFDYGIGYTSNTKKEFLFDLEDYEKIKEFYWRENNGYICCHKKFGDKKIMLLMHRLVMDCVDDNSVIDHINGNKNDNRKSNLRIATYTRNSQNRRNTALNNSTGFTGIKNSYNGSYRAYITVNGKNIDLGTYYSFEEAVRKRIKAELEYFGEFSPSA